MSNIELRNSNVLCDLCGEKEFGYLTAEASLSRIKINHVTLRHYGTDGSSCGLEHCGRAQSRFRDLVRFLVIRRGFDRATRVR
jgi:hypothetical protein